MPGPIIWGPNNTALNLENGIQFGAAANSPGVLSGAVDPTSSAVAAGKGSIYMSTSTGILYVKQDNGSSTNWTALSGASSPLSYISTLEDFTVGYVSGGGGAITAERNWYTWTSGASPAYKMNSGATIPTTAANPGVLQLTVSTNADGGSIFTGNSGDTPAQAWLSGSGLMSITQVIKINALGDGTNNQTVTSGFMNGTPWNGTQHCMRIEYSSGSANWVTRTMASSTSTTTTTTTPVTTGWHRLMTVCDATAANVTFYVDGVLVATHTTNIPSVALAPGFTFQKTLGNGALVSAVDLIWAQKVLTTSR